MFEVIHLSVKPTAARCHERDTMNSVGLVPRCFASLARGSTHTLGRAERGLYGGKKVMTGNNVSHAKNR